jgi:hypothetical protein
MARTLLMLTLLVSAACNNEIYVRDGVTDGDTFFLADQAISDDDPVLQSWVTYSLAKSACQLEIGGPNPARENSYGCELSARQLLLDSWDEHRRNDPSIRDDYLDQLSAVREAGHLDEYVVRYFGKRKWQVPAEVDVDGFKHWRRTHMRRHRAQTRIIGSWNYAKPARTMRSDEP